MQPANSKGILDCEILIIINIKYIKIFVNKTLPVTYIHMQAALYIPYAQMGVGTGYLKQPQRSGAAAFFPNQPNVATSAQQSAAAATRMTDKEKARNTKHTHTHESTH